MATHNQRGLGTLHIGCTELCDEEIDAATLLEIVEQSMSSEIYELMKRSDEAAVVEKAHRRPRFVEDCVREMIQGVVERYPTLDDRAFVSARQVNLETIHQHNVVAERFGTLGRGTPRARHGRADRGAHEPPRLARSAALSALAAWPTPPARAAARRSSRRPESTVTTTVTIDQQPRATADVRGRRSRR